MITNQKDLRAAFWAAHPELEEKSRRLKVFGKSQNFHPCDTRMAFVDFVDMMQKSGQISSKLAFRATL